MTYLVRTLPMPYLGAANPKFPHPCLLGTIEFWYFWDVYLVHWFLFHTPLAIILWRQWWLEVPFSILYLLSFHITMIWNTLETCSKKTRQGWGRGLWCPGEWTHLFICKEGGNTKHIVVPTYINCITLNFFSPWLSWLICRKGITTPPQPTSPHWGINEVQ